MRILFVVELPLDSLTGGSLYERNVARRLRARGHEVTLWAAPRGRPPDRTVDRCDVVLWDGMSLIGAHARWGGLIGQKPQAAIVHSPFAEPSNNREPWLAVAGGEPGTGDFTARLAALERKLFACLDAIIVPSRKIAGLLAASYGADPRRLSVHPPTANLPIAAMPARSLPADRWVFASVGAVTRRKNQHVLLEALAAVPPALFAGRPWTLRLAGRIDAEPDYVARIAAAARALRIEAQVAWGPAGAPELLELLAGCHLHLFPSHDEGYGMAVYETSCAGVPTAFVEANCALDGEAWSLPPVRSAADPRAWTEAIEAFLAEPQHWEALAAARRRAPRSWDDVAAGIDGVLRSLAGSASAHEGAVRRYYEPGALLSALTPRSSAPKPIHRRLRVRGADRALDGPSYVHGRIAAMARERGFRGLLDLGCGYGALLWDLRRRGSAMALAGITISARQARIARSHLRGGASVTVSTYLRPAAYPPLPAPRLLTAIESFVHAADRHGFLRATAAYARAGDRLVVCDDFVARGNGERRAALALRAFRVGWRAPAACSVDLLQRLAAESGWRLAGDEDWTPLVPAAGRLKRGLYAALIRLPRPLLRHPLAGNLIGGAALVVGYGVGLFSYRCLVFERQ